HSHSTDSVPLFSSSRSSPRSTVFSKGIAKLWVFCDESGDEWQVRDHIQPLQSRYLKRTTGAF
ncbi:MAG: hypothetical protein WBV79_19290, partial [Rhodomicrobium sp.]